MERIWLVDFDDTLRTASAENKLTCAKMAVNYGLSQIVRQEADLQPALTRITQKLQTMDAKEFYQLGLLDEGISSAGKALQTIYEEEIGQSLDKNGSSLHSRMYNVIYDHYNALINNPKYSAPVSGAFEFFTERKNHGDRLAIITDRDKQVVAGQLQHLLAQAGAPSDLFEYIAGAGDHSPDGTPLKLKPSRELHIEALRRMGMDEAFMTRHPVEIAVIGDRPFKDIKAANSLKQWLKKQNPKSHIASVLLNSWNMPAGLVSDNTTSLWMQYSPDLLRMLAKEKKGASENAAENLADGLTLLASAFIQARNAHKGFQSPELNR